MQRDEFDDFLARFAMVDGLCPLFLEELVDTEYLPLLLRRPETDKLFKHYGICTAMMVVLGPNGHEQLQNAYDILDDKYKASYSPPFSLN